MSGVPERPNLKPWAIGAAALVIAGLAAALVTGGPSGDTGSEKVLAAAEANVQGIRYRVVASTPSTNGPKSAAVPLYLEEYTGTPPKLLQRVQVPNVSFYGDSVIATFKVVPSPAPNPGKTARVAISWFHHSGDGTAETKRYGVTQHGIQLY